MSEAKNTVKHAAPLALVDDEPRKPGRGKGCEKPAGSGRKKGTKNLLNHDMKQEILVRGRPLEVLCTVAAGRRMKAADPSDPSKTVWTYPTATERVAAARTLLGKILPDVKATELTGKDGDPLFPTPEVTPMEIGRRVAYLLANGDPGAAPEPRRAAPDDIAAQDFRAATTRAAAHPAPAVPAKPAPPPLEAAPPEPGTRQRGMQYELPGATLHFDGYAPDGLTERWHVLDRTGLIHSTHSTLAAAEAAGRLFTGADYDRY
jgi:hypothetical protein